MTVDLPVLDRKVSWAQLESLMVELGHRAPAEVLALVLDEAQEMLVEQVCGARRAPRARDGGDGEPVPFACPGCGARHGFVRKGRRTRPRKLRTAAGLLELRIWHVGCTRAGCGKVFSPLLVMLGLSGRRRTDRLTLDLAELGTQMSFARSAAVDRMLAGTDATAGQAHAAMADLAAVLAGDGDEERYLSANRRRAIEVLRQLAERDAEAARSSALADRWTTHDDLVRGDPVRVERQGPGLH